MNKLRYASDVRNKYIRYFINYSNDVYDNLIKQDLGDKEFKELYVSKLEEIITEEEWGNQHFQRL